MSVIDEEPVLYRDVAALRAEPADESPETFISGVHRAADAVGQGVPLRGDELDALRAATRRLRRAIEVRAIVSSTLCRSCGEMFLRENPNQLRCASTCGKPQ